VLKLPPHILPHADQAKARSDDMTGKMIDDIRRNLEAGVDPTAEWWSLANSIVCCAEPEVAASLASSLLRLATVNEPVVKPAESKPDTDAIEQYCVVWTPKHDPAPRETFVDSLQDAWYFIDQASPVIGTSVIMKRTITPWTPHVG
jgi:hypothetical protein